MQFPTKHTHDQKAAIIRLVIEEGYTTREAVAAASTGVYTLAAFSMPASTAKDLVWRERQRRAEAATAALIEADPGEAIRQMTSRIGAILRSELDDIEKQSVPTERLSALLQTTKHYAALVRALDTPKGRERKAEDLRARVAGLRMESEAEALQGT